LAHTPGESLPAIGGRAPGTHASSRRGASAALTDYSGKADDAGHPWANRRTAGRQPHWHSMPDECECPINGQRPNTHLLVTFGPLPRPDQGDRNRRMATWRRRLPRTARSGTQGAGPPVVSQPDAVPRRSARRPVSLQYSVAIACITLEGRS
jgi:hypothetical protein